MTEIELDNFENTLSQQLFDSNPNLMIDVENFRFENCIKTRVCCNFCGSSKTQHFSKASIQQGRHKKDKISKQQFLNRVWERESSQEVGLNKTRSNRVGCFAK